MEGVIVIPTYEERDNIGELITCLQDVFATMPHTMHILVVDDNSPDGTADVVRHTMQCYPHIHLITGQKQGLGAAYIRGMHYALEQLPIDALMQMDADFSHKPADVPRLLAALEQGADFVIGSRYVPGGTIPADWGVFRTRLSQWGNMSVRALSGLHGVYDCTAGFRAIRAALLHKLDLVHITAKGYAFQVALLHAALAHQAVVHEVPVEFVNRTRGQTKLGMLDILEGVHHLWRLRHTSR